MKKSYLYIEDKWLNECIAEAFEETDEELLQVAEELQDIIRNIFKMNSWDEFKGPNYRLFNYNNTTYKIEIKEDGVCEVTNSHRILYWDIVVTPYCKEQQC